MKLLIVDDEQITKDYIKFIIGEEKLPIDILEASNGEEAIFLVEQMKPDLILMDIEMPKLNGLQAAKAIRELEPSTSIVFLSAYEKFKYVQGALRLGARDYLLKPVAPDDLRDLLERFIDDKSMLYNQIPLDSDENYQDEIILKAKNYIGNNYHNKISLKDISDHVGLSPSYFSKYFREKTGINFSHYLNQTRIRRAKELMRNPNLSLHEISYKVGYEDLSYFSVVFQKYEGMVPTKYRRNIILK